MNNELRRLGKINKIIDRVSDSFCLAKWAQVTLHLHNGRTHSCHHPNTHLIPIKEIEADPSALHNTEYKKSCRKQMLEGERPSECQYCWNVEDLDNYGEGNFYSDRIIKSGSDWALSKYNEVRDGHWNDNVNPSYVEVSFSNQCNFKCSYCSPVYSSKWVEEIEKEGPYPTSRKFNNLEHYKAVDELPIHHKEHNPYVDAFWDWWPNLVPDLKIFRITGGEPLLSRDTFKVLEYLDKNPNPKLEFAMNTNGGVSDSKMDNFIGKLKKLLDEKKIRKSHIFTSVDSAGAQAEYGRFGLNYDKWLSNVDKILTEIPQTKMTIMCTTNILSITNYTQLLKDVLALKQKHVNEHRNVPITIDVAILRYPHHQRVTILTDEYRGYMDDSLEFMRNNPDKKGEFVGFHDFEIARLERFVEFMKADPKSGEQIDITASRKDFYRFMREHDKRRGTNFLETFPELENFYNYCKGL